MFHMKQFGQYVLAFLFGPSFSGVFLSNKSGNKNFKGVFFIMAFKKTNSKANTNEVNAVATFTGILKDVFEGKTRNYATIRTMRGNYYDDFSVSFDKSYELPDGETECEVKAEISTFFDREINRSKTIFTGLSLTPIDGKKN